jgi:hypothetical protein
MPYDVLTVRPDGSGETFAATGITIRVYIKDCNGVPLPGIPREEIVIFNNRMCFCPGGNIADQPTDANGVTTFSGTLAAGGCVENPVPVATIVVWDGAVIGTLPVKFNSPDAVPASPCQVDASDFSALVQRRGAQVGQPNYSICFDYNEDGSIDASELSLFANALGAGCQ